MALDLVLFETMPVTVMKVAGAGKFLARLLTSDVTKLAVGGVERSCMMNATGGVIGLPRVARTEQDAYELILTGEDADAQQAWIRQVSVAFDAEIETETLTGAYYVGKMPIEGIEVPEGCFTAASGLRFMNFGWVCLVAGPEQAIGALTQNLIAAGAKKGEQTGLDALRIFAREPAMGLELTEGSSPLETGLESTLDFSNPERIFIGRALTEARAKAGNHLRMQLVAFDVPFDPSLLIEVPTVIVGENAYSLTSIARVPEGPFTVGLVRLPREVDIGSRVRTSVTTDPRTVCEAALVIDRQI